MVNLTVDSQPEMLVSPQPVPVNQPSHSLSKSILIGILIFVLLATVACGTYWYTKNYLASPSQLTVSTVPIPTPQAENSFSSLNNQVTSSVIDETADWKTYTNELNNWQLKYPNDWYFMESSKAYGSVIISPNPVCISPDGVCGSYIQTGLNVCTNTTTGEKSPCHRTLGESISNIKTMIVPGTFEQKNIYISGRAAIQIKGVFGQGPVENNFIKDTELPQKDGYLFSIHLHAKDRKLETIYDQILSTFRFD